MRQDFSRHRFSVLISLWAGVFAILLLLLTYLPRERPALSTGSSSFFDGYRCYFGVHAWTVRRLNYRNNTYAAKQAENPSEL